MAASAPLWPTQSKLNWEVAVEGSRLEHVEDGETPAYVVAMTRSKANDADHIEAEAFDVEDSMAADLHA